jgi:hypothetical protein
MKAGCFCSIVSVIALLSIHQNVFSQASEDKDVFLGDSSIEAKPNEVKPAEKTPSAPRPPIRFGISGEAASIGEFSNGYAWSAPTQYLFGVVAKFKEKVFASLMFGYSHQSSIPGDSAANTLYFPSRSTFAYQLLFGYTLPKINKFKCNIYGGCLQWNYDDVLYYPDTTYTYKVVVTSIKAGIEPECQITSGFSVYCRFGFSSTQFPNTKDVEWKTDPNSGDVTYRTIIVKNKHTTVSTDFLLLGLRFYFN